MFKKPFVVLDLETSGIDPKRNDIIEVAVVRYENGKEIERYDDIIKIDYELPEIITAITGITDEDIKKYGKPKDEVLSKVEKLIKGAYVVGHNIGFDHAFLKSHGVKLNILGLIDTIPLAQILYPQATSYSLESLTDDLEISHKESHRAMGDVEATLDLFKYLWKFASKLPKNLVSEIQELLPRTDWTGSVFFEEMKSVGAPVGAPMGVPMGVPIVDRVEKPLSIGEIFGEGGVVSQVMDSYETRPQQVEMADNIQNAFDQGYHLICEAPTGVGKSLAYLAVAANTAISNKSKVVISTNTINLQQQLFEKDIPLLQEIYKHATGNAGVRVAILKGRSHYLCLRRLAEFKRRPRFTHEELILLIKILVWQNLTESGDSSDIHLTRNENLIWDFELCADQKYCTPQKCKAYGPCYLHEAREKAENSDIIIVNHSLLCADLASDGGLLPDFQYLVLDEAHHFEEVATKSLGLEIKQENLAIPIKAVQNHLEDLDRRFMGTLFVNNKAFESITPILDEVPDLQQAIDNFFNIVALFVNRNVPDSGFIENLLIDQVIITTEEWMNIGESLNDIHERVNTWISGLRKFATALELSDGQDFPEQDDFLNELMQEISMLSEQLGHLHDFFIEDEQDKKWIKWITSDMNGVVSIRLAPLMVGSHLKEKLYDEKKSIILTSATLGVKLTQEGMDEIEQHPFTYLRQMLGLDDKFEEIILDSPFDFEKQVYIITPDDLFPVQAKNSIAQVSDFMKDLIKSVGGGVLGLFTSHGALENVYLNLMHELTSKDAKVLAQRISGGRAKIFKAYMNNPQNSVLLGTASFWEGVDIAGDALTTLVMHKFPFDVPSDPIYKVRSQMFNNGFMEYTIPRAILRFRQGFGRLIRSQKDYGVMIILDNRVITKDYGQMFLKALPDGVIIEKMKIAEVPEKVKMWLDLASSGE
ncbi:DEAD/DEAH box helicase family protein [Patescibacteria group bacterium]|nr:DEAD/DEAH box helicase family protein [Patescibacteria group bacterium]MBU1682972.1 DEAD/DEAH box helicase family protein [Patescibacteria group bacterium]